jgi:hypothetical protein
MQAVHQTVRHMVRAQETGARVVTLTPESLAVYDCAAWSDRLSQRLRTRFPFVEVDVEASTESLSGFVVLIRRSGTGRSHAWAAVLGLVLAGSLFALYRLASAASGL